MKPLALVLFTLPLSLQLVAAQIQGDSSEASGIACGFEGNDDFYGLGVRLAFYIQILTSALEMYTRSNMARVALVNFIFNVALFIALLRATVTQSVNTVEAYIALYLAHAMMVMTWTLHDASAAWHTLGRLHHRREGNVRRAPTALGSDPGGGAHLEVEGQNGQSTGQSAQEGDDRDESGSINATRDLFEDFSIAFWVGCDLLDCAIIGYGFWFWLVGIRRLPSPPCSPVGFFFSKTPLDGWLRILHIILFTILIISNVLLTVFAWTMYFLLFVYMIFHTDSVPKIALRPERGRGEWIAWIIDTNPWQYKGFRELLGWFDEVINGEEPTPELGSKDTLNAPKIESGTLDSSTPAPDLEKGANIEENENQTQHSTRSVIANPQLVGDTIELSPTPIEDSESTMNHAQKEHEKRREPATEKKQSSWSHYVKTVKRFYWTLILAPDLFLEFGLPVFVILVTEFSLRWNLVTGIHSLESVGQLIPLTISLGTVTQTLVGIWLAWFRKKNGDMQDCKEESRKTQGGRDMELGWRGRIQRALSYYRATRD